MTRAELFWVAAFLSVGLVWFVGSGGIKKHIVKPGFEAVDSSAAVQAPELPAYEDWPQANKEDPYFICHQPALEKMVGYKLTPGEGAEHQVKLTPLIDYPKYQCKHFAESDGLVFNTAVSLGYFKNPVDFVYTFPKETKVLKTGHAEHLRRKYAGLPVADKINVDGEPIFASSEKGVSEFGWICGDKSITVNFRLNGYYGIDEEEREYAEKIMSRDSFHNDSWNVIEPIIAAACGPKQALRSCEATDNGLQGTVEEMYRCGNTQGEISKALRIERDKRRGIKPKSSPTS